MTLISTVHHQIQTAKSGEGCHCVFLQELWIKLLDGKKQAEAVVDTRSISCPLLCALGFSILV